MMNSIQEKAHKCDVKSCRENLPGSHGRPESGPMFLNVAIRELRIINAKNGGCHRFRERHIYLSFSVLWKKKNHSNRFRIKSVFMFWMLCADSPFLGF